MKKVESFEDLYIWQESRILLSEIRSMCTSNAKHDFAFVDQITRSARSISANIAEGFESGTNNEFIKFLTYAKRSSGEVRSHLYDALDEGYISKEKFEDLINLCRKIAAMTSNFIQYLRGAHENKRQI